MTNREFVQWLAGFFELSETTALTKAQLYIISNHLNLAEAVEGGLGEFNLQIRQIVKGQIEALDQNDQTADQGVIAHLRDMVLTRASEF